MAGKSARYKLTVDRHDHQIGDCRLQAGATIEVAVSPPASLQVVSDALRYGWVTVEHVKEKTKTAKSDSSGEDGVGDGEPAADKAHEKGK